MVIVISIGGSSIVPKEINVTFLKRLRAVILKHSKKQKIIVVCGGGFTCRDYQRAAKEAAKISDNDLDLIGIRATNLNAQLLRAIFGKAAYRECVFNPEKKIEFGEGILMASGWAPGWSTDYDAVLLAKIYGARTIINYTDVDRVYTADPDKNPGAKPLKKLTWAEYKKLIGGKWEPGLKTPFDPVASRLAAKLGFRAIILSGIENLDRVLSGRKFRGTVIED